MEERRLGAFLEVAVQLLAVRNRLLGLVDLEEVAAEALLRHRHKAHNSALGDKIFFLINCFQDY